MNNLIKLVIRNLAAAILSIFLVLIAAFILNNAIDFAATKLYALYFDLNNKETSVLFHAIFYFIAWVVLFMIFYLLSRKLLVRFIK